MIFIVQRDMPTPPLYYPHMEEEEDEFGEKNLKIWETESDEELVEKLTELSQIFPASKLQPVDNMQWLLRQC